MLLVVLLPLLAACAGSVASRQAVRLQRPLPPPPPQGAAFVAEQLVKTDIDRVADCARQEVFASLHLLAEKLYRRNPAEWRKSGAASLEEALARLSAADHGWRFAELQGFYGVDAMQLALLENYAGDRVLALIGGLGGMMQNAFNDKTEFFMLDDLDPQRLHNSARNVEIAVWRLSNARNAEGALLLLSNEPAHADQPANLSFEREFGRVTGQLDLLARIVADKSNRTIARVFQSIASAVFLPVAAVK